MRRLAIALVLLGVVGAASFAQTSTSGLESRPAEQGQDASKPNSHPGENQDPRQAPSPPKGADRPAAPRAESQEEQKGDTFGYFGWAKRSVIAFVEFADRNDKAIVAVGTILIAAFTVILGIATVFLWLATRSLVHGADKTAERQLRAYVGVESIGITSRAYREHITVTLVIRNFGLTPAFDFEARVHLVANWDPAGKDVIPPDEKMPGATEVLMPGNTSACVMRFLSNQIDGFEELLLREQTALHIVGIIRYKDAFGVKRHTAIKLTATGDRVLVNDAFKTAEDGNTAT